MLSAYNGLVMKILVFVAGSFAGSLVSLAVDRIPLKRSILDGSECPYCEEGLWWYEKIPVLSWIFLRGRCSWCGNFYGWQDIICEAGMGLVWMRLYSVYGLSLMTLSYLPASIIMGIIAAIDIFYNVILFRYCLCLLVTAAAGALADSGHAGSHICGALIMTLPVLTILVTNGSRSMNQGVAGLYFSIGLLLAVPASLAALFAAFIISAASAGLALFRKDLPGLPGAWGAFLCIGGMLALCFPGLHLLKNIIHSVA